MSNTLYAVAQGAFARGEIHWENDTFWMVLLNATYVVDLADHRLLSDITPSARVADFGPLGNRIVDDDGWCLGGPISVERTTTNTQATQAIVYKRFADDPDLNFPVLYISDIGGFPFRFNRDFIRFDWEDRKVFRL